ncbi:MAG: ATP-binding protein, partial [Hymenobacter sp.]
WRALGAQRLLDETQPLAEQIAQALDKTREAENVVPFPDFNLRLLKSAVVYGANASGKSKLVDAMNYMRWLVIGSSKNSQAGESTQVEPFRLNLASIQIPTEFEVQFIYNDELYRYGFEVSAMRVEAEWLYLRTAKAKRNKPEVELFYRNGQEITFNSRRFGGITGELIKNSAIRENALLLSVAAQFNQPKAIAILKWFTLTLMVLLGFDEDWERAFTFVRMRYPSLKQEVIDFLAGADLDIQNIQESEQPMPSFKADEGRDNEAIARIQQWSIKEHTKVKTVRRSYTDAREPSEPVEFSLVRDESAGTQRMLVLAGPVLDAIENGFVLIIDEMDARLHPNLVNKIVQLFNSKTTNPNNAQLLFNTHDTNLLA